MSVVLGSNWQGINRAGSPHILNEGELADASDAFLYQGQAGHLGPRKGRYPAVLADKPILGVGNLIIPEGSWRITQDTDGNVTGTEIVPPTIIVPPETILTTIGSIVGASGGESPYIYYDDIVITGTNLDIVGEVWISMADMPSQYGRATIVSQSKTSIRAAIAPSKTNYTLMMSYAERTLVVALKAAGAGAWGDAIITGAHALKSFSATAASPSPVPYGATSFTIQGTGLSQVRYVYSGWYGGLSFPVVSASDTEVVCTQPYNKDWIDGLTIYMDLSGTDAFTNEYGPNYGVRVTFAGGS